MAGCHHTPILASRQAKQYETTGGDLDGEGFSIRVHSGAVHFDVAVLAHRGYDDHEKFEERNAMTIRTETPAGRLADNPKRSPRHLPYAAYPKARDAAQHGLQPLPESLPPVDFARADPYRSDQYSTVNAAELTPGQLLQMAWVIADSFARREPQARHLRPPKNPPAGLMEARHTDPFGTVPFGPWDTATQMYWIVRLAALTDPTTPRDAIEVNKDVLEQSLAVVDGEDRVIGAAFSETMPPLGVEPPLREGDPFLDTVFTVWEPVYAALGAQDAEALAALSERYPAFQEAYDEGKVTHHLLVARSDDLPKEDAFELVAASAQRCRALGYEYMVTEATNQWTGAAFEALGGIRVHFAPFQASPAVPRSDESLEDATTSPNGFLSDKDSGGMFYVIRLD
jgi:hypothetical protein